MRYQVTRTGGTKGTVVIDTTSTVLSDTGLEANTPYRYSVRAVGAAGSVSTESAPVSATTGEKPTAPATGTPPATDPRKDPIYFVLTTRFNDGVPANNRGGSQHEKSGNAANDDPMFRGDFKGLVQKLDYIKVLGFSAISQWSMTTLLSRESRNPLSPMAQKVYSPLSGASICPVHRAVVCSVLPVADSNAPVSPGKLMSGSRVVAPNSAKSRAPGADILKYSPFSPWTSVTGSSAVKARTVAPAGAAGAAAAVGTTAAQTGTSSAAAQVRTLNRARGRGCCRLKASSSSKSRG